MLLAIQIIHIIFRILIFAVIIQAILSFFMSPFHPIRRNLDQFIDPLLSPIRRFIPPIMNMDFSPLILVIVLQVVEYLVTRLLSSFA